MSTWGQVSLQDSNSPLMGHIESVHDWLMVVLAGIISVVIYVSIWTFLSKEWNVFFFDSEWLEVIWIMFPSIVLLTLAFPSLQCLYLLEEVSLPKSTIKAVGHQWYWSYELVSPTSLETFLFDSYLLPKEWETGAAPRLLDCDSSILLPVGEETRLVVSSGDVIHSWALPSMGVKVDAIPGRLNQVILYPLKSGISFGQCSEICGANHSFMPIKVEAIPREEWISILKG
uniref:Cytochrome c oxidase subunit 2 n=1 Tax=Polyplax asiatica TaxID=1425297 RepID=V9PXK9_9NEOP|nr:cytochrome c oxidase subunit 2 [Polyplax asiatica]